MDRNQTRARLMTIAFAAALVGGIAATVPVRAQTEVDGGKPIWGISNKGETCWGDCSTGNYLCC